MAGAPFKPSFGLSRVDTHRKNSLAILVFLRIEFRQKSHPFERFPDFKTRGSAETRVAFDARAKAAAKLSA